MAVISAEFMQYFIVLSDHCKDTHSKRHKLMDILVLTILVVIRGTDSWVDVELFGKCKEDWFKTFLELPHGIPSHDMIGEVFSRINSKELEHCFLNWIQSISDNPEGRNHSPSW